VIIVDLEGDLVAGTGDELLREVMDELVNAGWKRILINLSAVPRLDSAGLGELVASIKRSARAGASVRLLHVTGRVREVLALSQVLPLFPVHDNEPEAIAAFAGEDSAPRPDAVRDPASGQV